MTRCIINRLNQLPALLARVKQQWQQIHPHLPVNEASLVGKFIGVAANTDSLGMQALKQHKLTQSEHDVLACARRQEAPFIATPGLLLEEVRITSGALTTCINRLIKRELLQRIASQGDLRSKPVQLTDAGVALIDRVTEYRFKLAEELLDVLSFGEKQMLEYLLDKINQQVSALSEEVEQVKR